MIDTVIFDLDGTLLDTLDDLMISTNYVLKMFGFNERSYEEIKSFVGNGVAKLIERSLPLDKKEYTDKVLEVFKEHYRVHSMDHIRVYDGIIELLKELRKLNIKTAVVTNKFKDAALNIVDTYFNGLIDVTIGEDIGINKKPAPDMCNLALKMLNSNKDNALYIGDSEVDYQTAVNSNLLCVSCSWGFRTKELLSSLGSKNIIDKPIELLDYIK